MEDYVMVITLHADPAMPPGYGEWGGTHTYMNELLTCFTGKQMRCVMITRKTFTELAEIEMYSDYCTVIRLEFGNPELINKKHIAYYHEQNKKRLREIICRYGKPAVINSVYWNSGKLGMELAEEHGIPFVHSVISNARGRALRGAAESSPEREFVEEKVYNAAKYILAVSRHEKEDIVNLYGIDGSKILVAGQYVHTTFTMPMHNDNGFPRLRANLTLSNQSNIANRNLPSGTWGIGAWWHKKAFIYIGRMHVDKGVCQIVRAWHKLYRRRNGDCASLWLAGGSPDEIEAIRRELRLHVTDLKFLESQSRIVWWGVLDERGLSTLLLKSCAMIAHSLYEPGGRVIVEAFCQGIPVLATPNGFAKDYIEDFRNGFLTDYNDIGTLANRMELFVRQPFLSHSMGNYARVCGGRILGEWSFFDTHLFAYEASCGRNLTNNAGARLDKCSSDCGDDFKKRYINAYPFTAQPISPEQLQQFVQKHVFGDVSITPVQTTEENSSQLWRVKNRNAEYIIKRPYTKYSLLPLYHPYFSDKLTDAAFHRLTANKLGLSVLDPCQIAGYDDELCLLLLKTYEGNIYTAEQALEHLGYYLSAMAEWRKIPDPSGKSKFLSIPFDAYMKQEEIHKSIESYNIVFPSYPCGGYGDASCRLAFAMWPNIIRYNAPFFTCPQLERLENYISVFAAASREEINAPAGYIHGSAQYKHFIIASGYTVKPIDTECMSFGYTGYDAASLLYSIAQDIGRLNDWRFWEFIMDKIPPELVSGKLLPVWLAHYTLTELMLRAVCGGGIGMQMALLEHLRKISEKHV